MLLLAGVVVWLSRELNSIFPAILTLVLAVPLAPKLFETYRSRVLSEVTIKDGTFTHIDSQRRPVTVDLDDVTSVAYDDSYWPSTRMLMRVLHLNPYGGIVLNDWMGTRRLSWPQALLDELGARGIHMSERDREAFLRLGQVYILKHRIRKKPRASRTIT